MCVCMLQLEQCVCVCVWKMLLEFSPTTALSLVYLLSKLRKKYEYRFPSFPFDRNLADMDSDGKMDRLEFSIAMKLIKLKLQGRNLPSSLPVIMKQPPVSNRGSNIPSAARFGTQIISLFNP